MIDMTILVGDAGGTNVRFALAELRDGKVALSPIWKRPGADFPTFHAAMQAFLTTTHAQLAGASFGLAGVVRDGRVDLLHRSWSIDRRDIATALGVDDVVMVNDFFAMARAAPEIDRDGLDEIAPGQADPHGSIAVGGPGTGLGIGVLRGIGGGWVVVAGEGGHQAYSPQTEVEWRLAEGLRRRGVYVSNEVIASGSGFEVTRAALAEVMGIADPGYSQQQVIDAAVRNDDFALEFCRIRARTVMTTMGNLALSSSATGGVYLAGGVTQRLIPWLKEKDALDRFRNRGPRTEMVSSIPIRVISSEAAPLLGAAHLWLDQKARGWL
jgi:glucokinase